MPGYYEAMDDFSKKMSKGGNNVNIDAVGIDVEESS